MGRIIEILKKAGKGLLIIISVLFVLATIYYGIEYVLKDFVSFSSRAVLSNFIVFVLVIVFVMRQAVHPKAILEKEQTIIETQINDSEAAKAESEVRLTQIEESMANIEKEIDEILSKSEENALLVGEKILKDAEKTALVIKENTTKAIENSKTLLKNELLRKASLVSIEIAKSHIIEQLRVNADLHNKLIDESVEAIKEVNQ